jgi:thiol-disulfide isomerase/thioredoxin
MGTVRHGGRWAVVVALVAVLAVVAGCSGERAGAQAASPLAECTELTAPPGAAAADPAATDQAGADTAAGGRPVPDLTLPCFTGDEPVALPDLRGPAVVNLWASWCPPCREELPDLQRYADRAAGEVHVVGVVTEDGWDRAASFAVDFDLEFPSLFDRDGALPARLGTVGLPVTLFINEAGRLVHVYQGPPFDESRLSELVEEHLGVAVPVGEGR